MCSRTPKGVVIMVAVIIAKVKATANLSFRKEIVVGKDMLFACFIAYDAPK